MWIKIFSDRVEYKPAWLNGLEIIPIAQISSVKIGNWAAMQVVIETTGGREYVVRTGKKQEVADAIYQAQAGLQSQPLLQVPAGSVADELIKLVNLRDQGILSSQEFELQKTRLIGGHAIRPASPPTAAQATRPAPSQRPVGSSLFRRLKLGFAVVCSLFVLLAIIGMIAGPEENPGSANLTSSVSSKGVSSINSDNDGALEAPNTTLLSEQEKKFFGAELRYLKTVHDEDARLADVMIDADAAKSDSSLDDIKVAIARARSLEEHSYSGDYQSAAVPPGLGAYDAKIRRCKALHDSAFKEILAFWVDSKASHINDGMTLFHRAVLLTNECINDGGTAMTTMANNRIKGGMPNTAKP